MRGGPFRNAADLPGGLYSHIAGGEAPYSEALAAVTSAETARKGVSLVELADNNAIVAVLDCRPFLDDSNLTCMLRKAVSVRNGGAAVGKPGGFTTRFDMNSDAVIEVGKRLQEYAAPVVSAFLLRLLWSKHHLALLQDARFTGFPDLVRRMRRNIQGVAVLTLMVRRADALAAFGTKASQRKC